MNVIDVYPEAGVSKLPRLLITALAVLVIILLGVVIWLGWQLHRLPQPVAPTAFAAQTVVRIDVGSGMEVVAVRLGNPVKIQQAALTTQDGEIYETVSSLEELVQSPGFMVPAGVTIRRIRIVTADGTVLTYGGE